jgi:oxidase EvaA
MTKNKLKSNRNTGNELNSHEEIIEWINAINKSIHVNIRKISLQGCDSWFYDKEKGVIRNNKNTFFQIAGIQKLYEGKVIHEQPIIIQEEIGYLGIICRNIDGDIYFLMQAKIEPGNINKVQISPTIQATKSNFTMVHGGAKPAYLDYFKNADKYEIIVDQIQSEQSTRFYKKRNRNIIIKIDEEIDILPSHKWITLSQIKELLKINNVVNMDTRTVLACLPLGFGSLNEQNSKFSNSFEAKHNDKRVDLTMMYHRINNFKMYDDVRVELVPLHSLKSWEITDKEIKAKGKSDFKVIFSDIEIEGREVRKWSQPLFEAIDRGLFGLFTCMDEDTRKFLIKLTPEIGCFDKIELGPTFQVEDIKIKNNQNEVEKLFLKKLEHADDVLYDVILSEEGGRFYHEENRNVIININKNDLSNLSDRYLWLDFETLNGLVRINNILNIQLRNLLSLWEV